jgi:glyoxalase family protein
MQLTGIHHLTAISAKIADNRNFYTGPLGLRLVKKSVNQDDVSSYHLFYADGVGSPGTDMTFFDWPASPERRGTHAIVRTGFRIAPSALPFWKARLDELKLKNGGVIERDARRVIDFEDPEGQRLTLVADEKNVPAHPWDKSPVPPEYQIRGLGPITLSVPDLKPTETILTQVMNMRHDRQYTASTASTGEKANPTVHVYVMGDGGPAAELHVMVEPALPPQRNGAGGVHHVAFRVPTFEEYDQWNQRLQSLGVRSSGPVDRFYFRSLYFREPNGILFELATDGPGFHADEPMESLGQRLALPPFLEPRRKEIEAGLKPL